MKYFLDLRTYYNAKTVFGRTDTSEIWLDGYCHCFDAEAFVFNQPIERLGCSAIFRRDEYERDSIFCCEQEVSVPEIRCNRVTIAGICVWGYFKEKFEFIFNDGSVETVRAMFSDAAWPMNKSAEAAFELRRQECEDMAKILFESKSNENSRFIYHSTKTFDKRNRILTQIIFPKNMLMYVYGITLED